MKTLSMLAAGALALSPSASSAVDVGSFEAHVLAWPGASDLVVDAISRSHGFIVGRGSFAAFGGAFLAGPHDPPVALAPPALGGATAAAVNSAGQAVGQLDDPPGNRDTAAFRTGPRGQGFVDMNEEDGLRDSRALGINERGQVSGDAVFHGLRLPFLTDAAGRHPRPLGIEVCGRGIWCIGGPVNDRGQVVFQAGGKRFFHTFLTGPDGIGLVDIGTLGGTHVDGLDVNSRGEVVGWADLGGGKGLHAFMTGPDGVGMVDLGVDGSPESSAQGINDDGNVVGYFTVSADHDTHAFVTTDRGARLVDLNDVTTGVAGHLAFALSISSTGVIVAWGADSTMYVLCPPRACPEGLRAP
jgi:probable HAF family extracellular repeat protein